jgi:hypothetical protein
MGGKPSKGTKKDKRLKDNRGKGGTGRRQAGTAVTLPPRSGNGRRT